MYLCTVFENYPKNIFARYVARLSKLISNTVLRLKKIKERGISSFFKLPMYPIFAKSLMSQSGFVDVVQLRENPDF